MRATFSGRFSGVSFSGWFPVACLAPYGSRARTAQRSRCRSSSLRSCSSALSRYPKLATIEAGVHALGLCSLHVHQPVKPSNDRTPSQSMSIPSTHCSSDGSGSTPDWNSRAIVFEPPVTATTMRVSLALPSVLPAAMYLPPTSTTRAPIISANAGLTRQWLAPESMSATVFWKCAALLSPPSGAAETAIWTWLSLRRCAPKSPRMTNSPKSWGSIGSAHSTSDRRRTAPPVHRAHSAWPEPSSSGRALRRVRSGAPRQRIPPSPTSHEALAAVRALPRRPLVVEADAGDAIEGGAGPLAVVELPVGPPEHLFVQVPVDVFLADVVPGTGDGSLEQAVEGFGGVRVDRVARPARVLVLPVADDFMPGELLGEPLVGRPFVGEEVGRPRNVLPDEALEG